MAQILNADEVADKFSESIRALAKLTGFSERTVTLAECGIVLKTCAGRTKVADEKKTDIRSQVRALHRMGLTGGSPNKDSNVSINAGLKAPFGRVFLRKKDGTGWRRTHEKGFVAINRHYKTGDWIDLKEAIFDAQRAIEKEIVAGEKSIGLSRQSWVQIADDLGIVLEDVPGGGANSASLAKARRALATTGRTYVNGFASSTEEKGMSFYATLTNRLPYWPKLGFDRILFGVITGRAKQFQRNVGNEVFASHSATCRAYPWIKIVDGADN